MAENSQSVLRHVLESPFPKDEIEATSKLSIDEQNFQKMQDAYSACMNDTQIKEHGAQPLLELLSKVEELYPPHPCGQSVGMMDSAQKGLSSDNVDGLTRAVNFLMSIGTEAMVSLNVQVGLIQLS